MNNRTQQSANSAAASINAMLSILNGTTPMDSIRDTSVMLNPYLFIMRLLQKIAGYDRTVNYITELVVHGLPMLEDSVKISLLKALKNLFSCSLNPTINEELIQNGVVLDLKSIDLLNIMSRCPLDSENKLYKTNGSFFYSDVDGFTIPDQLVMCKDLNAVIWYTKNRASDRVVWYGYQNQDSEHELLTMSSKPSAKDGVITLEYNEMASDVKNSQGNSMLMQVPHNNCLHVFLGNTKGVTSEPEPSSDELYEKMIEFRQLFFKSRFFL